MGGNLTIINNPNLSEFCGLYALLNGGGLVGTLTISGNQVNPTQQQIIDGGPCTVLDGNLTLSSQAEVNAFSYTSYTSVTAKLEIGFLNGLLLITH